MVKKFSSKAVQIISTNMVLYTFYLLAMLEAYLVNAEADGSFLESSRANKNSNYYNGQELKQDVSNEVDDEPKFASAYPSLPSKDAKTRPTVPVGIEDPLNLQNGQGNGSVMDLVSSPILKLQLQNLRDLSGELRHLVNLLDGVTDRDSEEQYEPHLFVSIPLALKGMQDLNIILNATLFNPLQSLLNTSHSVEHSNRQTEGRSKRTAPTNAKHFTTLFDNITPEETLEPTTVDEEIPDEMIKELSQEMKMLEAMMSLKQKMDEKTAIMNKDLDILQDVAFSAAVFQNLAPFPPMQASPEKSRLTYNNFLLATKPQPVSFHETHAGNEVYRHGPTGIFFGTIWAKASPPRQQRAGDDGKDSMKMKGDLKAEPQTSLPIPLLTELLKNLEKSTKNPVDAASLNAAIVRAFESALIAYAQNNRKLRSGLVLEPKGEL